MRAMCLFQLNDGKLVNDLMQMSCLNAAIYYFAMASSVHWYSHLLRMEDGRVLEFGVNCQWMS